MPISSPGPKSLSIISFPLAPTCNSFTQPEMSSTTCRTESPWQKIACSLSNFFSRAAETTSLQAAEEAPENNEERIARVALRLKRELWPELCPAGCTATAVSSVWMDSISNLVFGDGWQENKCSVSLLEEQLSCQFAPLKNKDLRMPLRHRCATQFAFFGSGLAEDGKSRIASQEPAGLIRTSGQVICWSAKMISKLVIPWGHDSHWLPELRNSQPHAILRLLPESVGCSQPPLFRRGAQEVESGK